MPFEDLSSIQYYSPEEQLIEMTAALKEQFQRHCFIKIGSEKNQPLLVPFVKQPYTARANRKWYEDRLAIKQRALSGKEADEIIAAQEQNLLNQASFPAQREGDIVPEPQAPSKKPARKKTKPTKGGPLDNILDDIIGKE